jgi:hypothetical protein
MKMHRHKCIYVCMCMHIYTYYIYTHACTNRYGNAMQEWFESAEQWREADSGDVDKAWTRVGASGKARSRVYEEEELDFNTFEDQEPPVAAPGQASGQANTSKQGSRADVHAAMDQHLDQTSKAMSGANSSAPLRTPTSGASGTPVISVHASALDVLKTKSDEAFSRVPADASPGGDDGGGGDDGPDVSTGDVVKEEADEERRESDSEEEEEEEEEEEKADEEDSEDIDEDAISMKRKKALQQRPVDQMTAASEYAVARMCIHLYSTVAVY